MNSKHTPGPWTVEVRRPEDWSSKCIVAEVHDFYILCKRTGKDRIDEHEDNAYLIAAAPELLEACKAQLRDNPKAADYLPPAVRLAMVVNAISKAEGA